MNRPAVLVLDGDQPSALAIVRALSARGVTVRVGSAVEDPIAARSRHAAGSVRHADPLKQADAFIAWIVQRQQDHPDELIFPVTERTVVPLLRNRSRLPAEQRIALAPTAALDQVLDKARTIELARSLDVPTPRSLELDSLPALAAFEDQLASGGDWSFPIVVKPSRSVGSSRLEGVQLTVGYAQSLAQLRALVQHALQFGQVILQEHFKGDGVGVELIADRGEIRFAFQHLRLHEVPLTGGGSSLRVSTDITPELLEASARLIRALGWHGVAMVEFKHQPKTGQFRLMEINGRFWGSLPLAIAAGADFPGMLYELMTTGQIGQHAPARSGVLARQLARDLDWLEHVLRKAAPAGLVTLPSPRDVLRDCALVLSPRHHFDVQSWRDPVPGLVDIGRILGHQWGRVRGRQKEQARLRSAWQTSQQRAQQLRTAGTQPLQVLFLCYGNINRSALAHAHAQRQPGSPHRFASAGFHPQAGRPADPVMVQVAREQGLDLSSWRSQALVDDQVGQADLILAMEASHLEQLLTIHPGARGKAFLLGAPTALAAQGAEVPDPYGMPRATYERVASQVTAAVDAWFSDRA